MDYWYFRSMGHSSDFAPQWSMDLNSSSGSRGSFKGQSSRSIDRISIRFYIFEITDEDKLKRLNASFIKEIDWERSYVSLFKLPLERYTVDVCFMWYTKTCLSLESRYFHNFICIFSLFLLFSSHDSQTSSGGAPSEASSARSNCDRTNNDRLNYDRSNYDTPKNAVGVRFIYLIFKKFLWPHEVVWKQLLYNISS